MNHKCDLRDYQSKAVDFIKNKKRCGLWLDMGLGKTIISATAMADLIASGEVKRVLIIAPKATAINTWPEELKKWDHLKDLTVSLAVGAEQKRIDALKTNCDITVINRDVIAWLINDSGLPWLFDALIIDESTTFKNPTSKRFLSIKKVLKYINYTVLLTGTPAPNGVMDLWSQTFMLDRGERLYRTISKFRAVYFNKDFNGFSYSLKEGSADLIMSKIKDLFMTVDKKHAPTLPDRSFNVVRVKLTNELKKKYKELVKHSVIDMSGADIVGVNAAALYNKLAQFCNGNVYSDGNVICVHSLKLDALESLLLSIDSNVLLAYQFKSDYAAIKKRFDYALNIKSLGAIGKWNRKELKLLCAHPASAAHGLNLQFGGSVCVWYGLNWDLELYQQFNKRLHRSGQSEDVKIIHIVTENCIDDLIISDKLNDKSQQQQKLMEHINDTTNKRH